MDMGGASLEAAAYECAGDKAVRSRDKRQGEGRTHSGQANVFPSTYDITAVPRPSAHSPGHGRLLFIDQWDHLCPSDHTGSTTGIKRAGQLTPGLPLTTVGTVTTASTYPHQGICVWFLEAAL